jgi:hypothetical protein
MKNVIDLLVKTSKNLSVKRETTPIINWVACSIYIKNYMESE